MKEITTDSRKYILCHNNSDTVHCVLLEKGNVLTTSQNFVEQYTSLEMVKNRVFEITKDENYFQANLSHLEIESLENVVETTSPTTTKKSSFFSFFKF